MPYDYIIYRKDYAIKQVINIRLKKEMLATLDEYANELNKSLTSLIEESVEFYFDKLDAMVEDKRIDNLKSGMTTVLSLEEVFAKAGISVPLKKEE